MENLWQWQTWMAPIHSVWSDLAGFAPRLVVAILAVLIGLVLAYLMRVMISALGRWLKLDAKLSQVWLFRLWSRGFQGHPPSESLANFGFYIVLFLMVLLAVRILGVGLSDRILTTLVQLVPRLFSFILILFLGAIMAMFFSVLAQLLLASSTIQHPNFWGKVIAWGTFAVAIMLSLEQLGLAGQFLTLLVLILLGTAGLASAIAFGLGCKDLAKEFLIELLKEEKRPNTE